MFGRNVTLFEIFGFKVQINLTWAFLAFLVAWSLAQGYFPAAHEGLTTLAYWWMALIAVIGLLFSIVAHELAHSLVARRFGVTMRGITLFLFGGVAEMEEDLPTPGSEALVAIAGPITSVVLGAFFLGMAALVQSATGSIAAFLVLNYLAVLNLVLAVFNSIPAFPLDGGRVLRAIAWWWTGDAGRATRIAAAVGSGFGFLLIALGLIAALSGNLFGLWWVLLGLFINAAASSATYQLQTRQILRGAPISRFMTRDPVAVQPSVTVQDLVDNYFYRYYHDLFPVVEGARLVGSVGLREIKKLPREEWGQVPVREIAQACTQENCVPADTDAFQALELMQRTGNTRLMVTENSRLVGVVALRDLLRLLSLKRDLEGDSRAATQQPNAAESG